jgi:hypothetical protein
MTDKENDEASRAEARAVSWFVFFLALVFAGIEVGISLNLGRLFGGFAMLALFTVGGGVAMRLSNQRSEP